MKRGLFVLALIGSAYVGIILGFAQLGATHEVLSLLM